MLTKEIMDILSASQKLGWVLEPEAKRLFSLVGLEVPKYMCTAELDEAVRFANKTGYPVVAKVVSSKALHKTEVGGVIIGIDSDEKLRRAFDQFKAYEGLLGILVEEMLDGVELIIGSKIDYQFGPVILLGIGGTGVEIYKDTSLRMAPLDERDVASMVKDLKAHQLIEGYRGSEGVDLRELTRLLIGFSNLVMELTDLVESIDLNPVMCSSSRCVVADARIILNKVPAAAA